MAELRECPHCGGTAKLVDDPSDEVFVICTQCKSTTLHSWSGKSAREKAISAWNTRAYDAEMERLRAENAVLQEKLSKTIDRYEKHIARRVETTADALDRLRDLEDALERGELVRVPAIIGTNVFCTIGESIQSAMVESYGIYGIKMTINLRVNGFARSATWGKTVFATREEAEAALEKEGRG